MSDISESSKAASTIQRPSQPRRRRGFTVVETMTVAAVCSVWISIAVPYLQSSRVSGRETRCKNNMKQLGLAMHNYHDVYNTFPPGWNTRVPTERGYATAGWGASILPFVEQGRLYEQLNWNDLYAGTAQQTAALKTEVPTYRCPADSIGGTNPFRGDWGTSNYVGNFGSIAIPRFDPLNGNGPGNVPSPPMDNSRLRGGERHGANGIMAINSRVRFREITDGTSNTIMAGERSVVGKAAIWPGPRSNFNESDILADGSFASKLNHSATSYGSRHTSGRFMLLLCDGSVRAVTDQLESLENGQGILQKLSGRNDGMVIGEF